MRVQEAYLYSTKDARMICTSSAVLRVNGELARTGVFYPTVETGQPTNHVPLNVNQTFMNHTALAMYMFLIASDDGKTCLLWLTNKACTCKPAS